MELLHGKRNRVYLLYKLRSDESAERIAAGAGDEHAAVAGCNADFGFHAMQEFQELFGLARVVTLIVVPENAVGLCVDDDGLDRGRSHVEAHAIARLVLRSAALKRVRTRSCLRVLNHLVPLSPAVKRWAKFGKVRSPLRGWILRSFAARSSNLAGQLGEPRLALA